MPHGPEDFPPVNTWSYESADETATLRLGHALAQHLPPGACVVLSGPLGAGKTRLVQAVAEACDIPREQVISPTFVLLRTYTGRRTLVHADLYRLRDADEFQELGTEEWFDGEALVFIEWGERFAELLPAERLEITLEVIGPLSRRFRISPRGRAWAEWLDSFRTTLK